jgi:hypothetical protein
MANAACECSSYAPEGFQHCCNSSNQNYLEDYRILTSEYHRTGEEISAQELQCKAWTTALCVQLQSHSAQPRTLFYSFHPWIACYIHTINTAMHGK